MLVLRSVFKVTGFRNLTTMSSKVAAIGQMRSTNDKKFNREQVTELVERSKGKANILFLPECCDYVGSSVDETISLAETLNGETVNFYKDLW